MNKSIMLVDDDQIQHKIIELIINQLNLTVNYTPYSEAREVLSYLMLHHKNYDMLPDLILLDLDMPEITGWDFLDIFEILRRYFAKNISIVILTSSVDPRDREAIATYDSVKGFYSKPFTLEAMEDILASSYIPINSAGKQ